MSRIHPNFTYSSQCHELNASHEKISQRYGTHWFLHKLKDSIKFLEFSKSSKRREANLSSKHKEVNLSHTLSLCTSGDSHLERVLFVEYCFGMSPLNISNSISYLSINYHKLNLLSKYPELHESHTSSSCSNSGSLYVRVLFWNVDFGWVI